MGLRQCCTPGMRVIARCVGAQMAAKQEALAELQAKVESAEVAGDENSSRINDMQVRPGGQQAWGAATQRSCVAALSLQASLGSPTWQAGLMGVV